MRRVSANTATEDAPEPALLLQTESAGRAMRERRVRLEARQRRLAPSCGGRGYRWRVLVEGDHAVRVEDRAVGGHRASRRHGLEGERRGHGLTGRRGRLEARGDSVAEAPNAREAKHERMRVHDSSGVTAESNQKRDSKSHRGAGGQKNSET
jgi:hypothetical protein